MNLTAYWVGCITSQGETVYSIFVYIWNFPWGGEREGREEGRGKGWERQKETNRQRQGGAGQRDGRKNKECGFTEKDKECGLTETI